MYTSYIGKKFLKLYNKINDRSYSAEEFFEKVFFPLFFRDESHLMHVGNSPFFQKPKEVDVIKFGGKSKAQYANLKNNIEQDVPNMSIYVGSAAKDVQGTTSGQVSDLVIDVDKNEMYASWIGEALGIGVSGGFVMLIENEEILTALYKGWQYYRLYLSQTPNVKDKQIETWNGQWLSYYYSSDYDEINPEDGLNIETENVQGKIAIPTRKWSEIVLVLSKRFAKEIFTAYCYNLSQTNTTLGFINLFLPEVYEMYELRDQLFIDESTSILEDRQIQQLETFYNFRSACQQGTIGLKALEPAKLRDYMPKGSILWAKGQEFKFKDEESYFNYQLYKLWIMAVLNKKELLELASNTALTLTKLEAKDERGKKVLSTLSSDVRESKNLKFFIENLSKVILEIPTEADTLKQTVEEVLKMPTDNFPLFITLIRFEYNYQISKNK